MRNRPFVNHPGALGTSCAGPQAPAAPEPPSVGSAELLVGVREIPGTPSPQILRALPRLSLYGDGRAITPSGRTGALQTATVRRLTGERVRDLYRGAYATARTPVESPEVVDGGVLALTVAEARRTGASRPEPEAAELPLQADEIAEFRARTDPAKWPDTAFESGPRPYTRASLAVFATPAEAGGAEPVVWPYDDPGLTGMPTREGQCTALAPDCQPRRPAPGSRRHPGNAVAYPGRPHVPPRLPPAAAGRDGDLGDLGA
ncbi:hypothetical protein [Streptomyces spiramyceticus]|uniref:hypothetical protein n=1 Tax=Streptomyces spiramyceticus TaxID=299717 RepID=UPI00237C1102|nr:hypothetical protein [Streptomyces spiramyceticus]